ncbi:MAG: sigma-70 family RNA polymerase sigma factor [Oscillospiraceae bacterium]|nr:sigma-70 family RNA polymerase sigma factor [Oscillospiraceae bacterium]
MTDTEFTQLTTKYIDTVYRVALTRMKNVTEAEDITQTVFLKLYREPKPFASEAHVKHWLIRVTVNECNKLFRNPFRAAEDIADYANSLRFETPEQSDLFDAVMALPEKYRLPIFLYYYEDYSTAEISKLLKLPVPTVITRLRRGRERLKQHLQEAEYHV